jgi:Ca-activated chloride channel family protein
MLAAGIGLTGAPARGADGAAAGGGGTLEIGIVEPVEGRPVFGHGEVILVVRGSEPVARVELFLDARKVGERGAPPWRFAVDFGEENVARRLRAVVRGTAGGSAAAERMVPAIQVDEVMDIELQQLYVTVTRDGRRVLDLDRGDFEVRDQGDRQELVTFERGEVPLTAVLVLDSSLSMRGERLDAALRGARAFAAGMADLDEAMLLLFSDRLLFRSEFTGEAAKLEEGLAAVRADGGTALNDHLYLALQMLEARQGRRVVIVLSDGIDVDSVLPASEVLATVRRSQALVYWLRLRDQRTGDHLSMWRDVAEHREELANLHRVVEDSGGRVLELAGVDLAEAAFAEVLAELREQYVLGYYPTRSGGGGEWHEVDVRVARSGHAVRTRAGYFDE